jgi:hypothetical protein
VFLQFTQNSFDMFTVPSFEAEVADCMTIKSFILLQNFECEGLGQAIGDLCDAIQHYHGVDRHNTLIR